MGRGEPSAASAQLLPRNLTGFSLPSAWRAGLRLFSAVPYMARAACFVPLSQLTMTGKNNRYLAWRLVHQAAVSVCTQHIQQEGKWVLPIAA